MRLRKTIPVTALFFVGASMTLAQDTPETRYYPDNAVRKTIEFALRNIEHAKCSSAPCAPATAEEFANPPLTIAEARRAMEAALESAGWKWCGIANRGRIFDAFMRDARKVLKYDVRKRSLLALVHGNTEVEAERAFDRAGRPCPPEMKKQLVAKEIFVVGASVAPVQNMPATPYQPDDAVQKMIDQVLLYNEKPSCGSTGCPPATQEELANPPLTIAEGRRAMDAALESARWKWCGITNSERLFPGFIGHAQHVLKYDDRKLSLMSLIHGIMQARAERNFAAGGPCPPQLKKQLEAEAAQKFNRRP